MKAGLCRGRRPYASFLFYGPSGVGKTETCRALALELCGTENALVRLDMSEYTEKHTVSRLIGSPPGYIGYGESGMLTDAVRKRPFSVICFDNADKAHPAVLGLIRQILEEGELTDSLGSKADFSNAFIILTVNTENAVFTRINGFSDSTEDDTTKPAAIPDVLTEHIDRIIPFIPLNREAILKIVRDAINDLILNAERGDIYIAAEEGAAKLIADACKKGGAHEIRSNIIKMIEEPLSETIVSKGIRAARIAVSGGKINIIPIDKT